ncbi:MAG: hypothetical protein NTW87_14310 [Planctomycetota bacterium]|nr:hypothetical protein [Planctomycetota bacterium]
MRIVRRVAAFVPKMRKNGRMMRLDEYAYVAACFALLDILGARTDSNARKVDALDAPRLGLGARVDVKLIDELRRAPRDPDEPVRDCGRRWRQRRARFTRLGRKQAAAWKRWRECLQPVPGHGAIAVETEELHGKSLEEAA